MTVLQGLGKVIGVDLGLTGEVGQRTADPAHPVESTSRESQSGHGPQKQLPAWRVQYGMTPQLGGAHPGVAARPGAAEAGALPLACGHDP
jgi:hypothetical protein